MSTDRSNHHHRFGFTFALVGAVIGLVVAYQFDFWSMWGTGDWIPAGRYPRILILIAGAALFLIPLMIGMAAGALAFYLIGRAVAPLVDK